PPWDETARISELICLGPKQKYFCKRGWTSHFGKHEVICPTGKISTVAGFFFVIARSDLSAVAQPAKAEATKQSTPSAALDCFAEPVIGRAFTRPVGSQ